MKTKEIDKNLESMVIFLSKNLQEYKIRKNLKKKYRNLFKTQLNHI